MTTTVLSHPAKDLKGLSLKAVVPNAKKLLFYIEGELVLDYDGTNTMYDEWHALHYKGKDYDLHIYFAEWSVEDPDAKVILYGLEQHDDMIGVHPSDIQTDHSCYITTDIEFGFDARELFMKQCSISKKWYDEDEGYISTEENYKGKWISFEYDPED